jgi:phytoene dehydrogenase-like protein
LFDSSQAPPGKHTGLIWQFAPYDIKDGGPQKWDEIALDYAWECVKAWQEYAPNMTRENVLGIYPYTPLDIARKLVNMRRGGFHVTAVTGEQLFDKRPIPELAQYRVPTVQGLYMCGASQHVHGGILAMPGYNCMQQVAKDLGIEDKLPIKTKIWWQKREEWLKRAQEKKAQTSKGGR